MSVTLTYDSQLARVRLAATGLSVSDTFTRSLSGWGTADTGQVWTTSGGSASDYSADTARGVISQATVNTLRTALIALGATDANVVVDTPLVSTPTGAANTYWVFGRATDLSNHYIARLDVAPGGTTQLALFKRVAGTLSGLGAAVSLAPNIGGTWRIVLDYHGSTLMAKAWRNGTDPEPGWLLSATDTALTSGTRAGVGARLEVGNTTTLPVTTRFDNFTAIPTLDVQRSTDQVRWTTVRGGAALTPSGGALNLDDYEFTEGVPNYYRAGVQTGNITPALGGVWLKSLARPFLNRQVSVRDFSEVTRPNRGGVFEVVGRSFPVAVTDVRGSRRWTLQLATDSPQEASNLDLLLAGGDILLVHVPQAAGRLSAVPGGYVTVGDTREVTPPTFDLQMRVFDLPCVEVAAPGPDVIGSTVTCQTVLNAYATCQAVLDAHPTCVSLMDLVGDPTDVLVP